VQGFSHYFVRWEDPQTGERFNIDGSGDGWAFHDDEHYRQWPQPLNAEVLAKSNYLKSMSPREELSAFLTTRADCLRENGLLGEAMRTYQQAVELAPENLFARGILHMTAKMVEHRQILAEAERIIAREDWRRQPGMVHVQVPGAMPNSVRPAPPSGLPPRFQYFPDRTPKPPMWRPRQIGPQGYRPQQPSPLPPQWREQNHGVRP